LRLTVLPITSIDQHCELMGRTATRQLRQLMEERALHFAPRHVVLQPDLCVRASSLRNGASGARQGSRERFGWLRGFPLIPSFCGAGRGNRVGARLGYFA
jgi:hypothetical protein